MNNLENGLIVFLILYTMFVFRSMPDRLAMLFSSWFFNAVVIGLIGYSIYANKPVIALVAAIAFMVSLITLNRMGSESFAPLDAPYYTYNPGWATVPTGTHFVPASALKMLDSDETMASEVPHGSASRMANKMDYHDTFYPQYENIIAEPIYKQRNISSEPVTGILEGSESFASV